MLSSRHRKAVILIPGTEMVLRLPSCISDCRAAFRTGEALHRMDLAHRWQVDHIVQAFERKLADYIRVQLQHEPLESQASYLKDLQETARLKNLSILGAACRDYISRSSLEAKSKVGKVKSMASDGSDDEQSRQVKRLRVL